MAEVATGVLHNVGNVLNSVNVSATLVYDGLRQSRIASLAKAARLLRSHQDDFTTFLTADSRGQRLPLYLIS
jgi:two-component system sensor kinase FixL